jgi:CCR4-NOT transcription complex subunit 6
MALLVAKEKETGDEKRKGRPVLVASAHLFWDPAHADVKLAQAERLLAEAADFLRAEAERTSAEAEGGRLSGRASDDESALASSSAPRARLVADSTPIVLAGDFNSVPGSDVHARALRGVLLPRAEAENAEGYEGAEARDRSLRYRSLRSAYADAMASGSVSSAGLRPGETAVGFREGGSPGGEGSDPSRGSPLEPAHTTVTPGFTDCIDYVFVSEDVEVLGAEAIPGAGGALAAGLPNANRPSDHLPVTVRLAF